MGDTPTREAVVPRLRGRFGREYLYVASTPSTQRLLAPDAPEGAVAVADAQTEGRGRLGRHWEAPEGSSVVCYVMIWY
jgi:BirA family biotin operon repressor/biotin-[acetyl-CoA-carboxylase] ligase